MREGLSSGRELRKSGQVDAVGNGLGKVMLGPVWEQVSGTQWHSVTFRGKRTGR